MEPLYFGAAPKPPILFSVSFCDFTEMGYYHHSPLDGILFSQTLSLVGKIDKPIYCNLSINRSPTLRALAIIVKAGLTAALEGKKLPSTT